MKHGCTREIAVHPITLIHSNGDTRTVLVRALLGKSGRMIVSWGMGVGEYVVDVPRNALFPFGAHGGMGVRRKPVLGWRIENLAQAEKVWKTLAEGKKIAHDDC